MKRVNELDLTKLPSYLLSELPVDIIETIKSGEELLLIATEVKERMINELFQDAKFMNIELMNYAMELLDKEEYRKNKEERRLEELKITGVQKYLRDSGTPIIINLLIFGLIFSLWLYFRDDLYKYMNPQVYVRPHPK